MTRHTEGQLQCAYNVHRNINGPCAAVVRLSPPEAVDSNSPPPASTETPKQTCHARIVYCFVAWLVGWLFLAQEDELADSRRFWIVIFARSVHDLHMSLLETIGLETITLPNWIATAFRDGDWLECSAPEGL